jgi:hypothetical protein
MDDLDLIVDGFNANVRGVQKLINFDRQLLDLAISGLQDLHGRLVNSRQIHNPDLNGEKLLNLLSNIRKNDSLRVHYQTIFNQAVVLLVSYFASTLTDIFRHAISVRLDTSDDRQLMDEEVRVTFADLKERDWNLRESAPELLIAKKDLSFQDMGSTHRAFAQYLDVTMKQDSCVNNIIAAQACRHVIVHAGGKVTEKLMHQTRNAQPRQLRPVFELGERINCRSDEVELVWTNMHDYIARLVRKVRAAQSAQGIRPLPPSRS